MDNIKVNFKDVGWECLDWIHLAQDWDWWQAVVSTIMNIVSIKGGLFYQLSGHYFLAECSVK